MPRGRHGRGWDGRGGAAPPEDGDIGIFRAGGGEVGRGAIAQDMATAGEQFGRKFEGQGVGYEDMLADQGRLWKKRRKGEGAGKTHPLCWDASWDLGNAEHLDRDGHRSYAGWMCRHGHASRSRHWWLAFPQHGVVVELMHGTWVSWDGRRAPHCTPVPDVAEGDCLMSLFCSLPADAVGVLERGETGRAVLTQRHTPGVEMSVGHAFFEELMAGVRVKYRFVPPPPLV